ncbi:MAG: GIDE domain-containing protein, partial [Halobacteriaceae archaeon]
VCFTWRVLENDTDDDPDPDEERNWELTAMGAERLPFWLVTDAGERVRVDPADASLHVDGAAEVFVGAGEDPPARVREFCREAGVDPPGDAARRYEASALCPGDRAFVLGRAVEEGGTVVRGGPRFAVADAGYPDRVAGRVTGGLLLGVPTAAAGLVAVLFAAGAL